MSVTVETALDTYVRINAAREVKVREHKDELKELDTQLDKIKDFLDVNLEQLGLKSFQGQCGHTAFIANKDSVKISDKERFKSHLLETMLMNVQPHLYKTMDGEWQPDGQETMTEHVEKMLNSGAMDLLTLSANKNNCKDFMNSNDGLMPAGTDYTKWTEVQVRKGKAK